jgi:hypothetical protein
MRKKSLPYLVFLLLFIGFIASAQNQIEREFRIRKVQFPEKALEYIEQKLFDAKRIRFYKETDSSKVSYNAKFKKDRLWYGMVFNKTGALEGVEISIKSIDIPDEAFEAMNGYLMNNFKKYKIRKIHQQYLVTEMNAAEKTVENAFQNLLLPTINYELIVTGKSEKKSEQYGVLFDSEGNFKSIRKSLLPNYDHVLY